MAERTAYVYLKTEVFMKKLSTVISIILISAALVLSGCTDDTDNPEDPGFTMPSILSVSPSDNSTDVEPDVSVVITLDGAVAESLVPAGSVTMSTTGGPVSGSLSLDSTGKVITFTPESDLSLYTEYSIAVNLLYSDGSTPQSLEDDYSFRTRDGQWSSLMTVSDILYGSYSPQAAFYTADRALMVFDVQVSDAMFKAYSSEWNGSSWSSPAFRSEQYAVEGSRSEPFIASDGRGFSVAGWRQDDQKSENKLQAAVNDNGSWETAAALTGHTDTDTAFSASVAPGSLESAVLAWGVFDGEVNYIWADVYSDGSWGTAGTLAADHYGITGPDTAMDADGNAFAVWVYDYDAYYSRYNAATESWSAETALNTSNAYKANVACDSDGNAILMWYVGSGEFVRANFYDVSTGTLGTAKTLWDDGEYCRVPDAAFDGSGNILIAWFADGNIYTDRLDAGGWDSWTPSYGYPLETDYDASSGFPTLVNLDQTGNGFIAYVNSDGNAVKIKRYREGSDWNSWIADESSTFKTYPGADLIDSDPSLAVSPDGRAVISFESSGTVYAAVFE